MGAEHLYLPGCRQDLQQAVAVVMQELGYTEVTDPDGLSGWWNAAKDDYATASQAMLVTAVALESQRVNMEKSR